MKMPTELYRQLLEELRPAMTKEMQEDYKQKGLSDTRFRWDCFWMTGREFRNRTYFEAAQENELNDAHLDTALRKAVRELIG